MYLLHKKAVLSLPQIIFSFYNTVKIKVVLLQGHNYPFFRGFIANPWLLCIKRLILFCTCCIKCISIWGNVWVCECVSEYVCVCGLQGFYFIFIYTVLQIVLVFFLFTHLWLLPLFRGVFYIRGCFLRGENILNEYEAKIKILQSHKDIGLIIRI